MSHNFLKKIFDFVLFGLLYSLATWALFNLIDEKERGLERDEQIDELFSRLEDCEEKIDKAEIIK